MVDAEADAVADEVHRAVAVDELHPSRVTTAETESVQPIAGRERGAVELRRVRGDCGGPDGAVVVSPPIPVAGVDETLADHEGIARAVGDAGESYQGRGARTGR